MLDVCVTQKGRAVARTTAKSDGCGGWGHARSKSKGNLCLYYLTTLTRLHGEYTVRSSRQLPQPLRRSGATITATTQI